MSIEPSLFAQARLQMPDATGYMRWLVEHLQQEGVQTEPGSRAGSQRLQMDSVGTLELLASTDETLDCQIWPVDAPMLALVKMSLIEHAQEFLTQQKLDVQALQIEWDGDSAADTSAQPGLMRLRVVCISDITPRMRRFRLQAENLQTLLQEGLHVRLVLPRPQDSTVIWPHMGSDGRLQYPDATTLPLPQRIYTIVNSDADHAWLEIDMLRHGQPTTHASAPGAFWAEHAQPGSELAVITPAGGRLLAARSLVLIADNCGLPALERQLQAMPADAQAQVLAMVENAHEIRALSLPARHTLRWLATETISTDATSEALLYALSQLDWSAPQPELLWAACGDAQAKALRRWMQEHQPQMRCQISSYWR